VTPPSSSPLTPGVLPEPEPQEPPFSPAPVEELLRLVGKAARAQQLYMPNNPIYRTAIDTLRGGFQPVWKETDELTLTILETEIRWYDAVVAGEHGGSKSTDNLAWLFYKDGIRELTLTKGFEEDEVVKLLEMIKRARRAGQDEDDLVTMLWEADFTFLKYRYVDLLLEGNAGEVADGYDVAVKPDAAQIQTATRSAVAESRAGGIINMADFDATLYFLDEREIEYLHREIQREYDQDLRANIVAMLLDVFEAQTDPTIRAEIVSDLQTVMLYMLTAVHFRGVANLLREVSVTLQRATHVTQAQRDALAQLPERLSASEALTQLLQALDEAPSLPPQEELGELFDQLRPSALATVFTWLAKTENQTLKPLLEIAAGRLAAANTAELVRLIQVPEKEVSSEAIRRAGGLKAQAAVLALAKVLSEPDLTRRQLAAQALTEIGSPGALQSLERTIEDADRDVRVNAVRSFGARAYRPVLPRLEGVIKGKAIRRADLTEKMAFFECYGSLCGDAGVPQLDLMLNAKGFLAKKEDAEIRACAAIALGRIGTAKATEVLRKAAAEKDIIVRNAVTRALRGSGGAT
jgi:HEAT repeat protein